MNTSSFRSIYFILTLTVSASFLMMIPTSCNGEEEHVALFIYGDSLYDVGNNIFLKNAVAFPTHWPYGLTFFKHPTGRFCDGRIIPDFIAEYLKLPFIRPYLEPGDHKLTDGVNFASGGAGALVETRRGQVIDLKTQLSYFKIVEKQLKQEVGVAETVRLLSKALYLFSIGSNDYLVPFTTNSTMLHTYSKQQYVGMVIGNLTSVIKEIYKSGGRRFGILNVGPLGCIPLMRAINQSSRSECTETEATLLAKLHNRALTEVLKQLRGQLEGFKYSEFDFYTSLSERINHASKYGFKEGEVACCGGGPYRALVRCGPMKGYELCGNVSEYLFFDSAHPTEAANTQFAELMWSGDCNFTKPYNLKTIIEA